MQGKEHVTHKTNAAIVGRKVDNRCGFYEGYLSVREIA